MKKFLLFAVLAFVAIQSNATVHDIEVGGTIGVTPYYEPQFVTVMVGDTVRWTWVSGTHNVTSTSGPIPFSSGDLTAPNEFEVEFTQVGVYTFECTLFDHAETQFGSINVEAASDIAEFEDIEIEVFPNPASEVISFTTEDGVTLKKIRAFDATGRLVAEESPMDNKLNVSEWSEGNYILMIETSEGVMRERISIRK